jgi:hypothetical protein
MKEGAQAFAGFLAVGYLLAAVVYFTGNMIVFLLSAIDRAGRCMWP